MTSALILSARLNPMFVALSASSGCKFSSMPVSSGVVGCFTFSLSHATARKTLLLFG